MHGLRLMFSWGIVTSILRDVSGSIPEGGTNTYGGAAFVQEVK